MAEIKYAVNKETFEFNPSKNSTPEEAFWDMNDHNDKRIAVCDTLEQARVLLKGVEVTTTVFGYKLARATVAYIEESEFDLNDDGEWEFVSGSNYYDFKFEEFKEQER